MASIRSLADENSRCSPVTRFSRRPATRSGPASLRNFRTYARQLGYLGSRSRVIGCVPGDSDSCSSFNSGTQAFSLCPL